MRKSLISLNVRVTSTADQARHVIAVVFLIIIAALSLIGDLTFFLLFVYLGLSGFTFLAYAIDKHAARSARWRTRENTLHILELIGGWPGALLAQKILRHKTRKSRFLWTFRVCALANCLLVGWYIWTIW